MAKFTSLRAALIASVSLLAILTPVRSLVPYTRPQSILDLVFPAEDPFRILEHSPLSIPRVSARLEDGVLRISVPKLAEKEKKEPKVISIEEKGNDNGDVKPTKQEL
ncbi:Unknown protein [Striga hermonthica]|uniref:SHSP domain-containing protein n=1 Tax=Striga hermonthica TaxID=68872 RepID=A0A9N7R490_STRHE|nr:Unknown protein [Striga hermonthica]